MQDRLELPKKNGKKLVIDFEGGNISSDSGFLLLSKMEDRIGLLSKVSSFMPDDRLPSRIKHTTYGMLRQRVFGIACGYEDINDHTDLRHDALLQSLLCSNDLLSSSSTLCRMEQKSNRNLSVQSNRILVDNFINSYSKAPKEIILDFDGTDDLIHGNQDGSFYHGYYGNYCFLPLYVFCGDKLLTSYLRPSNIDGAKHSWAILSLLVKHIRKSWPEVNIVFRGDSGFCRIGMINWCDRNNVKYIVGIARNKVLERMLYPVMEAARSAFKYSNQKQKLYLPFSYKAKKWKYDKRVIGKAEYTEKGSNPRFIITNIEGDSRYLYEKGYCGRGDMENRIKEQQLDLFADRTSCSKWWPNQFRLILSSLAYTLMESMRSTAFCGTKFAKATCNTIRMRLFKVGAIIIKNTRTTYIKISKSFRYKSLFLHSAKTLALE
jgi:hypothetical protein